MLKTAYEMRISDCSSDVCSSDLLQAVDGVPIGCSAERFPDREERACDDGFVGRGLGRGGFDCSVPHCLEQRHVHHVFPRLALDDACETVMGRRCRNTVAVRQPGCHQIVNGSPLDDERGWARSELLLDFWNLPGTF